MISNSTIMTQYWRDKNGTTIKKKKKMSLPVELESREGGQKENVKKILDESRGKSCKAF